MMGERSGHSIRHRDMVLEVARRWAGAPARVGSEGSLLPLIVEACGGEPGRTADWHVEPDAGISQTHVRVRNSRGEMPEQGWKLHVSADVKSAEAVLRRVLPVLLAEDASFEVVASVVELGLLIKGKEGPGQIGKFITVYPKNDAQAIRLAVALDEATRGLGGPAILSDRPLASGGLVHYRYESFTEQIVQAPSGEILPAIFAPTGELVPDPRPAGPHAPDWVEDPFVTEGVAEGPAGTPSPVIGGRYVIFDALYRSPRGEVYTALDIEGQRRCVLKKRQRSAGGGGRDTRDYLRDEAGILSRLAPDPRFPALFGLTEQDGDLFLAMEYVEGKTLAAQVTGLAAWGRYVPGEQVATWGRELAAMLGTIHEEGLLYRDLKPNNVIVTSDGRLRLIDFEHACEAEGVAQLRGVGTRGYRSPQQVVGEPPAVTDDVYSLGALLYAAVTSTNVAPHPLNLLERPIELLNPAAGPALIEVITRCLDPDPAARFPSMAALDAALAEVVGAGASVTPAPFGGEPAVETEADGRRRYRELAKRLGDTLCKEAQQAPEGRGLMWVSKSPDGTEMPLRDLNVGGAGVVLALAELVKELDDSRHRTALAEGARWLKGAPYLPGQPLPGLYVGEAGVGATLLRAGQVLGDEELVEVAAERGRWISSLPHASPDVFTGAAGRLRFHLLLFEETNEEEHLRHAARAGKFLLERAEDAGDGGLRWTIPPGYGVLSGPAYLGYAHGAAGIAEALLDLFEATEDARFLAAARGAGRWLVRLAVPALHDDSGLSWPTVEGEPPFEAAWCHGATGIGRFFLHAARLDALPEAAGVAARAARTVARGARFQGPTRCHGLTGNIEFLLDLYGVTGDGAYLAEAQSLARLLEAFGSEKDGTLVWPSDSPDTYTPDYMIGYAGVAVCLLRLGDPEQLPHQLSREGFRRGRASSGQGRILERE